MQKKNLILSVFLLLASSLAYGRDLIVAGISEEPNRWVDESGQMVGFDVDVFDYIMKKMGVNYKIILEKSSARLQANWQKSNTPYDMVFTYSEKDSRKVYLNYATESHISFSWNFFIRKENAGKYKFEKYEDLRGLRIGATKGFSYTPDFWKAEKNKIFKIDTVIKNKFQVTKLLGKRFDMVPLNTQATLYEANKNGYSERLSYLPKPIKSKPYYNTFVKASNYPDLDKIKDKYDRILREMKEDGTLKKIEEKYGFQ